LIEFKLKHLSAATRKRDYPAFRAADEELHSGIIALADVPELLSAWRSIWCAQSAFHRRAFDECFPDARFLGDEHEHLVETITLGDPVAAEDAARSHVEAVWFRIARRVGYRDVSRFGQHFKRRFGSTPVEYRIATQP